jgi:hypothetical protein
MFPDRLPYSLSDQPHLGPHRCSMATINNQDGDISSNTLDSYSSSEVESFLPSDLDLDVYSDDEQRVQKAVAYLKYCKSRENQEVPSVRSLVDKFGVPRSTLRDRLRGVPPRSIARASKAHFTTAENEVLISLIVVSAERGFPLTPRNLCDTANYLLLAKSKNIADITTLVSQNTLFDDPDAIEAAPKVGKNWAKRWLKKHDERVKRYKGRKLDSQRAQALNTENVGHWFSLVREVYVREGDKEDGDADSDGVITPDRIYGMDETCGWFDHAGKTTVLGGKGKKNQYLTRKSSRESVTLIVSTCADGTAIKPFCIFSAKRLSKEWHKINPLKAK